MQPSKRYWHEEVGYNYRMTNIQAAIGLAQMESIGEKIWKRRWIAGKYSEYIGEEAELQPEMSWASNVYWLPTFMLYGYSGRDPRNSLMTLLAKKGVESRPVFYPLDEMPPYITKMSFPNSNYVSYHGISLPVSNRFDEADIRFISEVFNASVSKVRGH